MPSAKPLKVSVTAANVPGGIRSEQLIQFFSARLPDIVIERPRFEPGSVRMAAFDWYFLMAAGADIAAISSAIYDAYEFFVRPHRLKGEETAGLFFRFDNLFGSTVQGMLGPHGDQRVPYCRETELKVREIIESKGDQKIVLTIDFRESVLRESSEDDERVGR